MRTVLGRTVGAVLGALGAGRVSGAAPAQAPVSGLQHDLMQLVHVVAAGQAPGEAPGAPEAPATEHEAAILANEFTRRFFGHLFS